MTGQPTRQLPLGDYLKIKAGTRELTKLAGGQEAAAGVTRRSHVSIGRYGRPQDPDFAPVDVVADLEAEVGAVPVTRVLADLAGFVLVAKPKVAGGPDWARQVGGFAKEAGEAISRLGAALAKDGTVTAEEIRALNLRREVREAMEALAAVDASLRAIEEAGR
ncbi:hypothetical protein [Shumkonia mesophila]|uniref:hypothetical protein n=1 Tax=Shumkonia mesophila TaxID=2838854 RepID=UPI00293486B9|nr:hypothetical protein [Shumkonia mesophila]